MLLGDACSSLQSPDPIRKGLLQSKKRRDRGDRKTKKRHSVVYLNPKYCGRARARKSSTSGGDNEDDSSNALESDGS